MKHNLRAEAQLFQQKFNQVISDTSGIDDHQKYELLAEVIKFMKSAVNPFVANNINYDNAVFLMGPTGSGKSTLMNYLAGNDLYFRLFNDKPGIFPQIGKSIAFVGKGEGSTTLAPNIWVSNSDNFPNTTFIDCAGEFDSAGIIVDVINEKIKSIIAQNVDRAKIVIVTSQNSIGPAGSYGALFKQGLEKSAQFLNDISHFQDSMAFVVSHAGRVRSTPKTVKSYLNSVINNPALSSYKTILEKIVERDLLSTFSKYSEEIDEGELYTSPRWNVEQKKKLIDLVNAIEFQQIPENFFNLSTSPEVREQMRKAFSLVENKAKNLLLKSVEEAVSNKFVVHAIKLKDFVNFIEQELIAKPQELSLNDYIKFINDSKFIKISPPEEVNKLGAEIDFIWPYTRSLEQQHSRPKINWNAHIKYNLLLKDVLEQAKFIVHDAIQLFTAFCDKAKIMTIGCFTYSAHIKDKMIEFSDAFVVKEQIESSKHSDKYYYNTTESQFVRMDSQSYTESVPYTAKERYKEKVVKMVDVQVLDRVDRQIRISNYTDQALVNQGYILQSSSMFGFKFGQKKIYAKNIYKTIQEPKEVEEEREKDVIKYKSVTKYQSVPIYQNITVRKFDQKKYDEEVTAAHNKIVVIKSCISTLLNKANNHNKELKVKISLDKAAKLEIQAKQKSALEPNNPNYILFKELVDNWKSLEYENMVLQDYLEEIGLSGDV